MTSSNPIDLQHLERLTDDTGLFQHAVYALPDPHHGYCIDDNARGLLFCVRYLQKYPGDELVERLCRRYLMFVTHAYSSGHARFRNFMSYSRVWLENEGSEDSQGRAAWALGETVRDSGLSDVRNLAGDLFRQALPSLSKLANLRSWAFSLMGLNRYLDYEDDYQPALDLRERLARALHDAYRRNATADWPWWEQLVTYDNAKLCQAMWESGQAMGEPKMCEDAEVALAWLIEQQTAAYADGRTYLAVIGNDGWLGPKQPRATFDQQPLEAWALTEACMCLARGTDDAEQAEHWHARAKWCHAWFTGQNHLECSLFDPSTGSCCDGLQQDGVNRNRGAESTLSYLLSALVLTK